MNWCQCEHAGWCERHKINKSNNAKKMCELHRDLFIELDVQAGNITEPSVLEQASNLAQATTAHAIDGFTNVNDDEYNRRIKICESCPLFILTERKCRLCGCYMDVKTRWRTGSCPDNPPRW